MFPLRTTMCHQYNDDTSSEQQLTIRATVCEYFFLSQLRLVTVTIISSLKEYKRVERMQYLLILHQLYQSLEMLKRKCEKVQNIDLGVTMLDDARGKKISLAPPMFEPELFRKQIYSTEGRACDIVGTFRHPHSDLVPRELCPSLVRPLI